MPITKIPHSEMGRLTDREGGYCFPTCYRGEDSLLYEECPIWNVCYGRKMYERLQWFEDRHFAEVGEENEVD